MNEGMHKKPKEKKSGILGWHGGDFWILYV